MTRNTKTALALCVVMLGTAIEARADCKSSGAASRKPRFLRTMRLAGCWAP